MQVAFTNPTAATLSQYELSGMSHGQLLQCSNVLHAGWTSAMQKVASLEQTMSDLKSNWKTKHEHLEDEFREVADRLQRSEETRALLEVAHKQAMVELTNLRRTARLAEEGEREESGKQQNKKDSGGAPTRHQVEALKEELLFAKADILKLERALRRNTPLDAQVLQEQISVMERQRQANSEVLQERAVELEMLYLEREHAQEEIAQLQELLTETEKIYSTSMGAKKTGKTKLASLFRSRPNPKSLRADGAAAGLGNSQDLWDETSLDQSRSPQSSPRNSPQPEGKKVEFAENSAQTDAFLVKALDLLEEVQDEKRMIENDKTELISRCEEQKQLLDRLRREVERQNELLKKKEECITQLSTKPFFAPSRGGSTESTPNQLALGEEPRPVKRERCSSRPPLVGEPPSLSGTASTAPQLSASFFTAAERNEQKELQDQVARLKAARKELESELDAKNAENKTLQQENKKLRDSVSRLAEDNAKISTGLQSLGDLNPKQLESVLKSKEQVADLRAKLSTFEAEASRFETQKEELQGLNKQVSTLTARVGKYQREVASLTAKKDSLSKELVDAYAASEAQRRKMQAQDQELKKMKGTTATGTHEGADEGAQQQKERPVDEFVGEKEEAMLERYAFFWAGGLSAVEENMSEKLYLISQCWDRQRLIVSDVASFSSEQLRLLQSSGDEATSVLMTLQREKISLASDLKAMKTKLEAQAVELAEARGTSEKLHGRRTAEAELQTALRERAGEIENRYTEMKTSYEQLQLKHRQLASQYESLAAVKGGEALPVVMTSTAGHVKSDEPFAHRRGVLSSPPPEGRRSQEELSPSISDLSSPSMTPIQQQRHSRSVSPAAASGMLSPSAKVTSLGLTLAAEEPSSSEGTTTSRIWVESVARNGPAHLSGLRTGDVVLAVAQQPVSSLDDVSEELQRLMTRRQTFHITVRPRDTLDPHAKEDVAIVW